MNNNLISTTQQTQNLMIEFVPKYEKEELEKKYKDLELRKKILEEEHARTLLAIQIHIETINTLRNELENKNFELEKLKQQIHNLENQNIELKQQIHNLENQNVELKQQIHNLENQNIELKQQIHNLEKQNNNLENQNVELKQQIHNLETQNVELKQQITELQYVNNKRSTNTLFKSLRRSIQDINKEYKLESKNIDPSLHKLRSDRNDNAHYLLENLKNDDKNYRIKILYDKLVDIINNENSDIFKKFNNRYPDLLKNLTKHLKNNENDFTYDINKIDIDQIHETEDWWDEYN
jgi:chromosome segregation ATPase